MTTSSLQTTCLTTSTLNIGSLDTITLTGIDNSSLCFTSMPTTYVSSNYSGINCKINWGSGATVGGISSAQIQGITIFLPEEFVTCMPDINRIEKMCEEYPGLKIAFEKFKTVYKLVKDDYDTPKDKRPKP